MLQTLRQSNVQDPSLWTSRPEFSSSPVRSSGCKLSLLDANFSAQTFFKQTEAVCQTVKIFVPLLWELMQALLEQVYLWVFTFWVSLEVFTLKMKLVLIVEVLLILSLGLDTAALCYLVCRRKANLFSAICFGKEDNLVLAKCLPQVINILDQNSEFFIAFRSEQLRFREVFYLRFHSFSRCSQQVLGLCH